MSHLWDCFYSSNEMVLQWDPSQLHEALIPKQAGSQRRWLV